MVSWRSSEKKLHGTLANMDGFLLILAIAVILIYLWYVSLIKKTQHGS